MRVRPWCVRPWRAVVAAAVVVAAACTATPTPQAPGGLLANALYGDYTVLLLASTAATPTQSPAPNRFVHVATVGSVLYVVELFEDRSLAVAVAPQVSYVVGRLVTTFFVPTGPLGCNDQTDFSAATITANCATGTAQALAHEALVRKLWYVPSRGALSDACVLGGGDAKTCLGPPLVIRENVDVWSGAPPVYTSLDLLVSEGVAVESAFGYMGAIPSIAFVDMVMPRLLVTAPQCFAVPISTTISFSGPYAQFAFDTVSGSLPSVWRTFERADGVLIQMRVVLRRTSPASNAFQIMLADGLGGTQDAGFYRYYFASPVYGSVNGTSTQSWASLIPFGVTINMTGVDGNLTTRSNCTLVLGVEPLLDPPQLNPFFAPTSTNYLDQPQYPLFYATQACGFTPCGLDGNNQLTVPFCADGGNKGGWAEFITTTPSGLRYPIYVPADASYDDYTEDFCNTFYPLWSTFRGFGQGGGDGPPYDRYVPATERCNAPFYDPATILLNNYPQERQRQCAMMGMVASGLTQDLCVSLITDVQCKRGWVFFGYFCYYVFDPVNDAQFATTVAGAQASCGNIPNAPPGVQVLVDPDHDIRVWLQVNLGLQTSESRSATPGPPYFFTVPGLASCDCVSYIPGTTRALDVGSTSLCLCAGYPVCRYPVSNYVVAGQYVSKSIKTVRVLRDGQPGAPWVGQQATCACLPNSAGKACETSVCHLANSFPALLDAVSTDPHTAFASRCAAGSGGGQCQTGQPLVCFCDSKHGPAGALYPLSPLWPFASCPCCCPSASAMAPSPFMVDGVLYNGTVVVEAVAPTTPCGGAARGSCVTNTVTITGACECVAVFDAYLNATTPVNGGPACTCPMPKVPAYGFALQMPQVLGEACNGRGTCCPFGSGAPGPDGTTPNGAGANTQACFDDAGAPRDGCVCADGWVGDACTCPVPADVVVQAGATALVQTVPLSTVAFVDLGRPYAVLYVTVAPQLAGPFLAPTSCFASQVVMADSPQLNGVVAACAVQTVDGHTTWQCDPAAYPAGGLEFVVVTTNATAPSCVVAAYVAATPACGAFTTTNPFAGRFFANDLNDAAGAPEGRQQTPALAFEGCTAFGCMCAPDYTGPLCSVGVSAVSQDADGLYSQRVVGETTQPARGVYDATTQTASCLTVTTAGLVSFGGLPRGSFVGDACECFEYWVQDRGARMMCGGHGVCRAASFPWGYCGYDLAAWEADPLWTPLVPAAGNCNDPFERVVDKGVWLVAVAAAGTAGAAANVSTACIGPHALNPQAAAAITPYSNVLGAFYGLWWNELLGYDFMAWPFAPIAAASAAAPVTSAQFNLTASLLNGVRLFTASGSAAFVLDAVVLDAYVVALSQTYTATTLRAYVTTHLAWPANAALAAANAAYTATDPGAYTRPINASLAEDVVYVATVWSTVLAPRRCSGDVECATFVRHNTDLAAGEGVCVFDAVDYVPWLNGDPLWSGALSVGYEGGCDAYASNALGFWDPQIFYGACTDGYGPSTEADFVDVAQQQADLVAIVGGGGTNPLLLYDPTAYPFAQILASSGQAQVTLLNNTLNCRAPWAAATDGHVCGGFGTVAFQYASGPAGTLTVFRTPRAIPVVTTPMCTYVTVTVLQGAAAVARMNATVLAEQLYHFETADGTRGINVLGGTAYFYGFGAQGTAAVPGLATDCTATLPFACVFVLEGEDVDAATTDVQVACGNDLFFDPPYHVDVFVVAPEEYEDPAPQILWPRASGVWSMVLTGLA